MSVLAIWRATSVRVAYDKGLIIETSGSEDQVIKVLAPLTTPKETLRKGFNILMDAANDVLTEPKNIAAE